MINLSLKHAGVSFSRVNSYLKNFKLAHINWELNRQEDRLFIHTTIPANARRNNTRQRSGR